MMFQVTKISMKQLLLSWTSWVKYVAFFFSFFHYSSLSSGVNNHYCYLIMLYVSMQSRFYLGDVGNGAAMKLVVNMIMGRSCTVCLRLFFTIYPSYND